MNDAYTGPATAGAAGPETDRLPAFAAQTEDRLAELNLRLPHGEFDDEDVRLVDDARFAITELLARVATLEARLRDAERREVPRD